MRRAVLLAVAVSALAACSSGGGGSTTPTQPGGPSSPQPPSGTNAVVATMFQQLPAYLSNALRDMQNLLPRNPQAAAQINAKIALLQRPTLAAEVAGGRFYVEGTTTSIDGRTVQLGALFPEERLRGEASDALQRLGQALPVLEAFMATPFPATGVYVWYGFVVGNSGGNAVVDVEDRTSYSSRNVALPYETGLDHELAHTYIGNETLTQFLEMYVYNRLNGRGADLASWTHTRGYAGMSDSNTDSALTLDVYQLMGHDAMARAYKRAYPLRPPYSQPLSSAVIQVFVDEAPADVKVQVASKLGRVTF